MKVATFIDVKPQDVQKIENLYKKKLLRKNHVLTYGDFVGSTAADAEDMFEVDFYLELVNGEYQKVLTNPIEEPSLSSHGPRITARIEEFLQSDPLQNKVNFNHYRPARYFTENSSSLKGSISAETYGRCEEAFRALNALL